MKTKGHGVFSYYIFPEGLWFRIFGYGLNFTKTSVPMLFSMRNGYKKYWTIFNYRVSLLYQSK